MGLRRLPLPAWLVPAAFALLAAGALLACAPAARAVELYYEGASTGHRFSLVELPQAFSGNSSSQPSLTLALVPLTIIDETSPVWQGAAKLPNPRDAYPLDGGHVLTVDKENLFVAELDGTGTPTWTYSNADGAQFMRPFSAQPATFEGRRCVLITDRLQYRVFAVSWDARKDVLWQYGTTGEYGLGADHLMDPFAAVQLPNGNVLVSDENGGNRVIEIRASDYRAGQPAHGFTVASIVWQYGTAGESGLGVNHVNQPRWPQRLANGPGAADDTTLITDSSGHRVIEVRDADYDRDAPDLGYTASSIVWRYGSPGVEGPLNDPNRATRIVTGPLKGTTVIADADDQRILWVSKAGQVTRTLDTSRFYAPSQYVSNGSDPRAAVYASDSSLWIPDPGYHRVMRIGVAPAATVEWQPLDCGKPALKKAFLRLTLKGATMQDAVELGSFALQYRVDGGAWRTGKLFGGRTCDFPSGTAGKTLAFRVTFRSADRAHAPTLDSFSLQYTRATEGGSGGGGGGDAGPGANSGTGDGVYVFPAVSGTGTSGAGSGSGTQGYGSGSGTTGEGTGGAAAGAPAASAGAPIAAPPVTTAAGPQQSVSGVEVEGVEGVSGVTLKAAGGAHVAAETAQSSTGTPIGLISGVAVLTLAALFVPWPIMAHRFRGITGFDHTRPRRYPPYWPLRR